MFTMYATEAQDGHLDFHTDLSSDHTCNDYVWSEFTSCVKVTWTSWAPVPNKPTVSVDVKQHFNHFNYVWLHSREGAGEQSCLYFVGMNIFWVVLACESLHE